MVGPLDAQEGQQLAEWMDGLRVAVLAAVLAASMVDWRAEKTAAKTEPLMAGLLVANSDGQRVVSSADVKVLKRAASSADVWEFPSAALMVVMLDD